MEQNFQVLESKLFGSIRCIEIDGEPWFSGYDVGKQLRFKSPVTAVKTYVKPDDYKDYINLSKTVVIINKSGVKSLVKESSFTYAKKFERWLFLAYKKTSSGNEPLEENDEIQEISDNSDLVVFNNEEFGKVRVVMIDGEPYFVGKDIAEALGYTDLNKAVAMHVDEEDKLNDKTASSLGQRGGWLINESGMYSLIFSSKLSEAKRFKRWVTSEVLPSIRKTGQYGQVNIEEIKSELKSYCDQLVKSTVSERDSILYDVDKSIYRKEFANSMLSFLVKTKGIGRNILISRTYHVLKEETGYDPQYYQQKWADDHNNEKIGAFNAIMLDENASMYMTNILLDEIRKIIA